MVTDVASYPVLNHSSVSGGSSLFTAHCSWPVAAVMMTFLEAAWDYTVRKGSRAGHLAVLSEGITESYRLEGTSGVHLVQPSAKAGSLKEDAQEKCPGRFWIYPGKENSQPLWLVSSSALPSSQRMNSDKVLVGTAEGNKGAASGIL